MCERRKGLVKVNKMVNQGEYFTIFTQHANRVGVTNFTKSYCINCSLLCWIVTAYKKSYVVHLSVD